MLQQAGGYSKDPQSSNSLFTVGLQYPSIYNKLTTTDKKFTMQFIPKALSHIEELPIGARQDSWYVEGRRQDPLYSTGTSTGTGVGNTTFTVEFSTNELTPKKVVRFKSGLQANVLDGGTPTSGGWTYTLIPATNSTTAAIVSSDVSAGSQIGWAWTTFEELSKTGYGGLKYPDRYTNYTSISRGACSLSGNDATQITWIYDKAGKPMVWFPKQYQRDRDDFLYDREKKLWYANSNVNAQGVCLSPDLDGNMLVQGDGYVNQIDGVNIGTYTGQLQPSVLLDYLYSYINTANIVDGQEIMCITGTFGAQQFQNCLEQKYLYQGQYMHQYVRGGQPVELGNIYKKFTVGTATINLMINPIKDDALFFTNLNSNGTPKESCSFDLMCVETDGEPNIIRKVVKAGGINRSLIEKQMPGMISPMDAGSIAVTAVDGFSCQWLSEEMIEVLNPKACGRLLQN